MEKNKINNFCLRIQENIADFQNHVQLTETYWKGEASKLHYEVMCELLASMADCIQKIEAGEIQETKYEK